MAQSGLEMLLVKMLGIDPKQLQAAANGTMENIKLAAQRLDQLAGDLARLRAGLHRLHPDVAEFAAPEPAATGPIAGAIPDAGNAHRVNGAAP